MANDSTKDKIVQELFEVVRKRQKEIEETERAKWLTNCSFPFDTNTRVNLQVVSSEEQIVEMLSFLLAKKEFHSKACKELDVKVPFKWHNFIYEDWLSDFKTRINKIQIKIKKEELANLENRLDKLISKEMREQMELEAIKKELGLS